MSDDSGQDKTINVEPGAIGIGVGGRAGTVIEGPMGPAGRTVDARPASGGRALSSIDSSGTLEADLCGSLEQGRSGQGRVLKVLVQVLRGRGDTVEQLPVKDVHDDRGEDGVFSLNRDRVPVQVVSLPVDGSLWKDLAKSGAASIQDAAAVEIVRKALVHKRGKAHGTILALDATQIGAIASPSVVAAYEAKYGDPESEFRLREVWIVGPTVGSTIRLRAQ